jgi:hypothetical protein
VPDFRTQAHGQKIFFSLPSELPIELVEIEAVFSKATQVIAWRELQDDSVWQQGWV